MARCKLCDHDLRNSRSGILRLALLGFFLACLKPGLLVAGPPLVTDDPGILDPGSWEAILAVSAEERGAGSIYQLPVLDISRGITRNSQLSFVLPHFQVNPDDVANERGLTTATIGYKWRFLSNQDMECAIAANYTMPISHDLINEDGPDDVRVLSVPLLASWQLGGWTWLGQAGWNTSSDGGHFWDYGVAVSRPLGGSIQFMAEVYGFTELSFADNTMNYQLGVDYEINPAWHVLASVGSRVKSIEQAGLRLNYSFYLGLQWFTG